MFHQKMKKPMFKSFLKLREVWRSYRVLSNKGMYLFWVNCINEIDLSQAPLIRNGGAGEHD